jgi:putative addiction module component (TIGR02574 family)
MSSVTSVRTAAMQLDRQERADLARQLIASLDDEVDAADDDVDAAWLAEVERRVLIAEGGTAKFEPWEVVEERIAARLRDMRR